MPPSSDQIIKLGIIGTGIAARELHWPVLKSLPEYFKVTAVCNRSEPKAIAFADTVGLDRYYIDYARMLREADIDAVLVTVPIALNYQISEACARAGKHIICEKPVAVDLEQAEEMVKLPARHGVRLQIAEQFYYREDIDYARKLIRKGRLGKIFQLRMSVYARVNPSESYGATQWRRRPAHRGGFVTDAGVHHIALLRQLCGEVNEVHAFAVQHSAELGAEDNITVNMKFRSGVIGNYAASYTAVGPQKYLARMILFGDAGTLHVGYGDLTLYEKGKEAEPLKMDFEKFDGGFTRQWLAFYGVVRADLPIVATAQETYEDLRVILSALESAQTGKIIKIGME